MSNNNNNPHNPHFPGIPGMQPPRPPSIGPPVPSQTALPSMSMQFRPVLPPQPLPPPPQPQTYTPVGPPQFQPIGPPQFPQPLYGPVPPVQVPPQQNGPVPPQQNVQIPNSYMPSYSAPRLHPPLAYIGQPQVNAHTNIPSYPIGQPWVPNPVPPVITANTETVTQTETIVKAPSDWIEHTASHGKGKGKIYYHNKRTNVSSWQKPYELMTIKERADSVTDWKEFPGPERRKYYFNKVTKVSKWAMPIEVKIAREQMQIDPSRSEEALKEAYLHALAAISGVKVSPPQTEGTSPAKVVPSTSPVEVSDMAIDTKQTSLETSMNVTPSQNTVSPEEKKISEESVSEEKKVEQGPLVYESKLDAKNAFKALLESANVGSDWNWDQAMRVIINDKRYGAVKTLGERKQAFNEYVAHKKQEEIDERRARAKKARENYREMLEESKELTSSSRYSKSKSLFEEDERFKAIERIKEREDLFEDYISELVKKERAKILEEQKRNRIEYLEFLKSCDFIKASSQWRKVQDRLEADERCSKLDKIDRLEIFQEYISELEKEEEEKRKLRMEELRKAERKNRDEFRKLMEEHVTSGMLTAKTHWRDYCTKVKDTPAYLAVSSNASGSTAKDLFEDVAEELLKQYVEDKEQVKDAIKMSKITVSSSWTVENLKSAIPEDIKSPLISDINLKLIVDELVERAKEKEEKEAKKRKRLGDSFYEFLHSSKDISASSRWDDIKSLVEDRFGVDSILQETFDIFVAEMKEVKERERKRKEEKVKREKERKERHKRKDKHNRREKESRKRHNNNNTDSDSYEDYKRSSSSAGRDKDKDKDRLSSRRRTSSSDRKRSNKQMEKWSSESDSESQYKRQKRGGDLERDFGESGEGR